jgi:cell division septal protein FtsQ
LNRPLRGSHPRRRRSSRFPRISWPRRPTPPPPLAGQAWTPGESPRKRDERERWPRRVAVLTAIAELGLLTWLLAGPAFQVRQVTVVGNHQLKTAQVVSAAGLQRPGSVFALDTATIRRKLTATAWVRTATVTTSLPDRVTLRVDEWQPVAVYVAGGRGQPLYLSDQAAVLGAAPDARAALEIDGPAGTDPKVGAHPIEPRLLIAAVNIQRGLPGLVNQDVRSFAVDGCGDLTMTVQRGWRVEFGRVITPEEFAALNQKLAALKSVASKEDLNNPDLDYVNLDNAQLPAIGLKSKPGPSPTPSPPAAPQPSPSAAAPKPVPATPCR